MTTAVAILTLALFATLTPRWCRAIDRRNANAAADAEWAAILAVVGLTPQDMRARWRQQEAANRAALEPTRREIAALPTTEQP